MMIRSIISIRVLFADLLFRFRDRNIFDESRRLVRGRGGGTLRASHYDQGVRAVSHRTCDTGGRGVSGSQVSIGGVTGAVTIQRPTLVTGSGCWISWPPTTPQWTGMPGMWTQQLRGAPVLFWAHTGWQLRLGDTGCVTVYCIQGVRVSALGSEQWQRWPGLTGDTGLARRLGPVWCRHQTRPHHVNIVSSQEQKWKVCN